MGKSGPSSRPGAHVKGWALPSLGMCMWTSWTRQWAHWAYWTLFHNLSSSVSKKEKLSSHTRMWLVFYWLIAKIATGVFLHPNAVLLEFQIRLGTCSGGYVSTKTNSVRRRVLLEDLCDHCHESSTSRGFLSLHYGCVLAFQRCGIHILLGIFDKRCIFPIFLN